MNYIIVKSYILYELENEVNNRLFEGYKCLGGVAIDSTGSTVFYLQAMIKENE